eukprot:COSAG01_NODE_53324_length_340_cov_0.634855_2_plen_54_part_01
MKLLFVQDKDGVLRDDALQPVDASTHHYITRVLYALTFSLLVPHHSRLCIIVCT